MGFYALRRVELNAYTSLMARKVTQSVASSAGRAQNRAAEDR
jgi:hypothetical protein